MALTYPRAYPFYISGVGKLKFGISRIQNQPRTRGGVVQGAEKARSLWMVQAETPILNADQFEEMQAFFDSLRGVLNPFTMYDPKRRRPRSYPGVGWAGISRHTGGAFDGTATLAGASGYQVLLSGLPTNFNLLPGDLISWPWRSTRALHRAVEAATSINGQMAVQVEPDVIPGTVGTPSVKLEDADAVFKLVLGQDLMERGPVVGEPYAFSAIQALY